MHCRHCATETDLLLVDLGNQPSANKLPSAGELRAIENGIEEPMFPLRVYVCGNCYLAQLADFRRPETMFRSDYAYYSSYSGSWMDHARRYVDMVTERFGLSKDSFVVEVASNDGYLLRNFVANGVPCLGVDPAENCAERAKQHGVETIVDFFGTDLAKQLAAERGHADLVLGNNVLAHVPDINSFVAGLREIVAAHGVITLEFPHLARLLEYTQFDTIYDEHYSYLSLGAVSRIFEAQGLNVFDVEELPTHGGSLRVFGQRADAGRPVGAAVASVLDAESRMGLDSKGLYESFQAKVNKIRDDFLDLVQREKAAGKKIAAFGAAAKGNTFLNYCGVGTETIDFVVDDTPVKQGRYLPGSHIPVVPEDVLKREKPDLVIILAWNFAPELTKRLSYIAEWGGRVATAIPEVRVTSP
jgi:hypothetical protein